MSLRTQRSLQALVLAALGMFLMSKIWSGTLFWYLNQRFLLLVLGAAAGLLALARITLATRPTPAVSSTESPTHAHDQPHSSVPMWAVWVMAVPVLLGVLIPARPLGASAMANKGINGSAPLTTSGGGDPVRLDLASTDRTILDWVRAFNFESDARVFEGQAADVVGFVYHDSRLAEEQFLVGRFALTCCVADAVAIGMVVDWAQSQALPTNAWVRVHGLVSAASLDGRPIPRIAADSVEQVAEPDNPYLYP
jgi:uncharacterized repeat protein (TIGR03943 family)